MREGDFIVLKIIFEWGGGGGSPFGRTYQIGCEGGDSTLKT